MDGAIVLLGLGFLVDIIALVFVSCYALRRLSLTGKGLSLGLVLLSIAPLGLGAAQLWGYLPEPILRWLFLWLTLPLGGLGLVVAVMVQLARLRR